MAELNNNNKHITCARCLGTGHSAENERWFPVVIGGASGAIPHTATTRPCRRSTQQQETEPVETVSQATLGTTKTGKTHQRIQWSKEMNTFIMRQYYIITKLETGTAVAQWLRCCATNWKVAGSIPAGVTGFFIDIKSFRSHYGPGVDSASNRNEYQEYFLGVKAAGV